MSSLLVANGKVLAHLDSIGGNFAAFMDKFCASLADMGVSANKVTCVPWRNYEGVA